MKIYLASDHGGFRRKEEIEAYLRRKGYKVEDLGPFFYKKDDDYPDYVLPLARKVVREKAVGIVFCRNGQGVSIATNKVRGVRAVTGFSVKEARTTRQDDNANVLCLPAEYLSLLQSKRIVSAWLTTPFSGKQRHKRRLRKIQAIER